VRSASVITTLRFTTLKPCYFTDKSYVPGNKSSDAIPLLFVCNTILAVSDDVVAATETSAPPTAAPDSSFTSTDAVTLLWANTREHTLAEASNMSRIVFTLPVYSRRDWGQNG
jgi:hypothetical protein